MLRLALRNVLRQKVRTAITLAAIAFGVMALVLSGGFVEDMLSQLGETIIHSQSGHIQVNRKGFFETGSRSPEKFLIETPDEVHAAAGSLPEVEDRMGRVSFSGLLNNGRTDMPIIGEGVEPGREATLGTFLRMSAGRQLTDHDHFGMIVGEGIARSLQLFPGSRVTLVASSVSGALNTLDMEVVGVFQSFSKEFDARAVRIPLAAAHELLANDGINTVVISLRRTPDTNRAAAELSRLLDRDRYEVKTWYQINDFYEKAVDLYDRQFAVLNVIILVMVLLSVANSVNMTAFERIGEFGTMMALGNRRSQVRGLFIAENAILGAIGATLGVVLGILLALAISAVGIPMPPPPNSNLGYTAAIRIVPAAIGAAFLTGFAAAVLASILPARRVTRTPVAEALRHNV